MNILQILKSDDPRFKGHLWFFLGAYFLVLFNYPLVRAASTTMFFEDFGAKSTPLAWLWSVAFLIVSVFLCNHLQARHSVHKVFFWASSFTTALFGLSVLGFVSGIKQLTFLSFIWKEVYIVIQIHLLLAYANTYFRKDEFKMIVGVVGAAGSLGGVLGGLLTSYLSHKWGTVFVAWFSLIFIFSPAVLFFYTPDLAAKNNEKPVSPMKSLKGKDIKEYVFIIAVVVMLSQFIINIADFKFNLAFEAAIPDSASRTGYLGWIYTWTNLLTFILQFLCMPLLLPRISEKTLHLFIPVSYLILTMGLILSGGTMLLPLAGFYIYLKASDYSLFSGGKELLYQPLTPEQKYGAKYLTDMLVYRASKALIAAVLIYLQSSFILNMMMISFLLVWLILVIKLFGIHRKLFS
ncbi:MFS transporter [Peredibacter sp. HCB2-198]|uniref:MFS transporter n=1 Tax=Peredibacter sp. HCB2-198 TaxID=3383025 RepID=UPI0038B4BBEE